MKPQRRFLQIIAVAFMAVAFMAGPAQAAAKDTLVYVMGAEPPNLDPPNQADSLSSTVIHHLYDFPIFPTTEGGIAPGLIMKWETSANGKTWTFHLQKGVKFHDGTPFNAEALKFNWDRCMSTEKRVQRRSNFESWAQNIKVVDEYTLQITSERPFAPLLYALSHSSQAIVSPAAIQKYGTELNRNPVGSGPFKFVEWVAGERIVLERNDEYWGTKPKLKRIIFKFVKESASRVMMLETGEADLVLKIPPTEIERLQKRKDLEVLVKPCNRVVGFYANTTAPLVKDLNFRKALLHAIDRESMIKNVMKGLAEPCNSVIGGGTFYSIDPGPYEYNPQKAKELLARAGYNGEPLEVLGIQGRYSMDRESAEVVQGFWQKAGINAQLKIMELASVDRATRMPPDKVKYQLAFLGAAPGDGDGDLVLRGFYHSSNIPPNGINRSYYNNPEYDKWAEMQATEVDIEKRKMSMAKCQEILARDLPYLPLYTISQEVGVRKNLKGVEVLKVERTIVRNAYFED